MTLLARATSRLQHSGGRGARFRLVALTVAACCVVLIALDLVDLRSLALASFRSSSLDAFRITSPAQAAVLADGNLVLVEGEAADSEDGRAARVEVSFDDANVWTPAHVQTDDQNRWSYVWADATPGTHRIVARVVGDAGQDVAEQSVTVEVRDSWDTPFIIANPYASPGSYRKGQLHTHSTSSFDGWESLPPAQLALEYKRRGYQFVAITDHEVISQPREVEDGSFITIPAYESTSDGGHITEMWTGEVVEPETPAQDRLDFAKRKGGMAILNHPSYSVGWSSASAKALRGYFAIEVYNGIVDRELRSERNLMLWHEVLNAKGWPNHTWVVAVDDAHRPDQIDRGWVMVKAAQLTGAALRGALEQGAFYASNGPSFENLGVMGGAIMASSPDATTIRIIDQDRRIVKEGTGAGTSYKPTGRERWVRVEAVSADGRQAWSQPFWLLPNAPKVTLTDTGLAGQTLPGARVHVSDGGQYLGNVLADEQGAFAFASRKLGSGAHDLAVTVTAPWPDQISSSQTTLHVDRGADAPVHT